MSVTLKTESDGEILTIGFAQARISDEIVTEHLHRELIELVLACQEPKILLDFQGVRFLASAALGVVIRLQKRCRETGRGLKLCRLSAEVRQVFKVTNLEKILDIHESPEEAMAAFDGQSFRWEH